MEGRSDTAAHERALIDLAHWLGRIQQYSASHPACQELGRRAHESLSLALESSAPLVASVTNDSFAVGTVETSHPVLRTRFGPYLHERGVLAIRIATGVGLDELTSLLEILALPALTTFDRGGLSELVKERGIARIEIEELAHDVTAEERAAHRRRTTMRSFFGNILQLLRARRELPGVGEQILELLDSPQIAVAVLEENPLTVAEAVAGFCLMVREEEAKTGAELYPKLRVILLALSAASHDRVLLGLPALVGEFREALVWGLDGLSENELALFSLPAFRRNGDQLETVFYALGLATPHDGRRLSMLRSLALRLYDLPADDAAVTDLIGKLAQPEDDSTSTWRERDCLRPHAARVLTARAVFSHATPPDRRESARVLVPFKASRVMYELVKMAARTRRFETVCGTLPTVAGTYARDGSVDAVLGIVKALREISKTDHVDVANRTLVAVLSPLVTGQIIREFDTQSALAEGAELEELASYTRLLVRIHAEVVLEQLESSESRKMRRIIVEALAEAGPSIAPLVRTKLRSQHWFVVRNAVSLLPSCGAAAADYEVAVRHPHEKVRSEVLRALRLAPPGEAVMATVACFLADPVAELRARALTILRGDLLGPRAVKMLEEAANDDTNTEELKKRVVWLLGRCPHNTAAAALLAILQPRGLVELGSVRDAAAVALRGSPAPLAPEYFEEGLHSTVWRVRKACERAAAERGGPS